MYLNKKYQTWQVISFHANIIKWWCLHTCTDWVSIQIASNDEAARTL